MMINKVHCTRNALIQTNLRVVQLKDETIVVCDRGSQTITTTPPSTLNINFFTLLEFTPYSEIVKGSIKVIDLPRKALLQFNFNELSTRILSETNQRSVLKKSITSFESQVIAKTPYNSLKMEEKSVANQDCQTILTVSPNILDDDAVANVYTELAIQTSITFEPCESLSSVTPKLKQVMLHTNKCQAIIVDGKIVRGFDDEEEDEVITYIQSQANKKIEVVPEAFKKEEKELVKEEINEDMTEGRKEEITDGQDIKSDVEPLESKGSNTVEPIKINNSVLPEKQKQIILSDEEFEKNVQMILDKTVKNVYDFLMKVLEIYNRSVEAEKPDSQTENNSNADETVIVPVVATEPLDAQNQNKVYLGDKVGEEDLEQQPDIGNEVNVTSDSTFKDDTGNDDLKLNEEPTYDETELSDHVANTLDENIYDSNKTHAESKDEPVDESLTAVDDSNITIEVDQQFADDKTKDMENIDVTTETDVGNVETDKVVSEESNTTTEVNSTEEHKKRPSNDLIKMVTFADDKLFGDSNINQHKHVDCECGTLHEAGAAPPALSQSGVDKPVKFELTVSNDKANVEKTADGFVVRATISCPEVRPNKTSDVKANSSAEINDQIISLSVTIPRNVFTKNNEARLPPSEERKPSVSGSCSQQKMKNEADNLKFELEKSLADLCECLDKPQSSKISTKTKEEDDKSSTTELNQQKIITAAQTKLDVCYCDLQKPKNQNMDNNYITEQAKLTTEPTDSNICERVLSQSPELTMSPQQISSPASQNISLSPADICDCQTPHETVVKVHTPKPEHGPEIQKQDTQNKQSIDSGFTQSNSCKCKHKHDFYANLPSADLCECIKLQERTIALLNTHTSVEICDCKHQTIKLAKEPLKQILETELHSELCECSKQLQNTHEIEPVVFENRRNSMENHITTITKDLKQDEKNVLIHPLVQVCDCGKLQQSSTPIQMNETPIQKIMQADLAKTSLELEVGSIQLVCHCNKDQEETNIKQRQLKEQQQNNNKQVTNIPNLHPLAGVCDCGKIKEIPTIANQSSHVELDKISPEIPTVIPKLFADVCGCNNQQDYNNPKSIPTRGDDRNLQQITENAKTYDDEMTNENKQEEKLEDVNLSTTAATCDCNKVLKDTNNIVKTRTSVKEQEPVVLESLNNVCDCSLYNIDHSPKEIPTFAKDSTHVELDKISPQIPTCIPKQFADVCDCNNQQVYNNPKSITKDDNENLQQMAENANTCDYEKLSKVTRSAIQELTLSAPNENKQDQKLEYINQSAIAAICDCNKPLKVTKNMVQTHTLVKVQEPVVLKSQDSLCDCSLYKSNDHQRAKVNTEISSPVDVCDCTHSPKNLSNVKKQIPNISDNVFSNVCDCNKIQQNILTGEMKEFVSFDPSDSQENDKKILDNSKTNRFVEICDCGKSQENITSVDKELKQASIDEKITNVERMDTLADICNCEKKSLKLNNVSHIQVVQDQQKVTTTSHIFPLADICDCTEQKKLPDNSQRNTSVDVERIKTSDESTFDDICKCTDKPDARVEEDSHFVEETKTPNELIYLHYKGSVETYMNKLLSSNDALKKEIDLNNMGCLENTPEVQTCICKSKEPKSSSFSDKSVEPYMMNLLDDVPSMKTSKQYQKQATEMSKMDTVEEEEAVEVLYLRNEAQEENKHTKPLQKSHLKSCVCKGGNIQVISKSDSMYDDDSDYNENYMEELKLDLQDNLKIVKPESTPSIPPYMTDTDRCDSRIEMPWLQISLAPPGYYEIKKTKEDRKNICGCWDVDKKDSVLSADDLKSHNKAEEHTDNGCVCDIKNNEIKIPFRKKAPPKNTCYCLQSDFTDDPPPKKLEVPNSECSCFDETIVEKPIPVKKTVNTKELDARILCGCLALGLEDKDSEFIKSPSKLVYDTECYGSNEPYMDPLSKQFPDDCDTADCGPHAEISWNDIIIPKNVRLRHVKKSPPKKESTKQENDKNRYDIQKMNVLPINTKQMGLFPDRKDGCESNDRLPITPTNTMVTDDASILNTEMDTKLSYTNVSNLIKIEGGAASLQTLSAMSTISDIKMKLKRVPKDFTITVQLKDGGYQTIGGGTAFKTVGSQPFIATLGNLGIENDQISGIIISTNTQSNEKFGVTRSDFQNGLQVENQNAKSLSAVHSIELAAIDMTGSEQVSTILAPKNVPASTNKIKSELANKKILAEVKPVESFEYKDPVIAALEKYRAEMKPLQETLDKLKTKIRELGIPELNNWNNSFSNDDKLSTKNDNISKFTNTPDYTNNFGVMGPNFSQQHYGVNPSQTPYSQGYYPMPNQYSYLQNNMYGLSPSQLPQISPYHNQNILYPHSSDWKLSRKCACKNMKQKRSRQYASSKSSSDVSDYDTLSGEDSRSSLMESIKATSNDEFRSRCNSALQNKSVTKQKSKIPNKVDFSCDENSSEKQRKQIRSDFIYRDVGTDTKNEQCNMKQLYKGRVERNQSVSKSHKFRVAVRLPPSKQQLISSENVFVEDM